MMKKSISQCKLYVSNFSGLVFINGQSLLVLMQKNADHKGVYDFFVSTTFLSTENTE